MRDRNGNSLPGYGWIFPLGDGTINVGIGLLSTFRDFKSVNTTHLMNECAVDRARALGHLDPDGALGPATGGRLPMGGSIEPEGRADLDRRRRRRRVRSTRSTARASTTRTRPGAWPPSCSHEALATGDGLAAAALPAPARRRVRPLLQGRPAVRAAHRPPGADARAHPRRHAQSRTLMEWVLRIMANLLEPDELGPAEAVYKAVAALARAVPD